MKHKGKQPMYKRKTSIIQNTNQLIQTISRISTLNLQYPKPQNLSPQA